MKVWETDRPGMYTAFVFLDPKEAEHMLEHLNDANRNLRMSRVRAIADDIVAGRFQTTHQGVALDTKGKIVDGQHRLAAIALAGKTVRIAITYNVPPSARQVVDSGASRSTLDTFALGFDTVESAMNIRTLRAMCRPQGGGRITNSQLFELYRRHRGALRFTDDAFGQGNTIYNRAQVRAVVARAWYTVDHAILRAFAHALIEGVVPAGEEDAYSGVIRLRHVIESMRAHGAGGTGASRADLYRRAQRALKAFVGGESLSRLAATKGNVFLLPEEQREADELIAA